MSGQKILSWKIDRKFYLEIASCVSRLFIITHLVLCANYFILFKLNFAYLCFSF